MSESVRRAPSVAARAEGRRHWAHPSRATLRLLHPSPYQCRSRSHAAHPLGIPATAAASASTRARPGSDLETAARSRASLDVSPP